MNEPEKIELFAKYLSDEFHSLKLGDGYYLSEVWKDLGITNWGVFNWEDWDDI